MNFKDEKEYCKYINGNLKTLEKMLDNPEEADLNEIMSLFDYLQSYIFQPSYDFPLEDMGAYGLELNRLYYKFVEYLLKDTGYQIDDEFMYRQRKKIFKEESDV